MICVTRAVAEGGGDAEDKLAEALPPSHALFSGSLNAALKRRGP